MFTSRSAPPRLGGRHRPNPDRIRAVGEHRRRDFAFLDEPDESLHDVLTTVPMRRGEHLTPDGGCRIGLDRFDRGRAARSRGVGSGVRPWQVGRRALGYRLVGDGTTSAQGNEYGADSGVGGRTP